jgi:hypothetical protein
VFWHQNFNTISAQTRSSYSRRPLLTYETDWPVGIPIQVERKCKQEFQYKLYTKHIYIYMYTHREKSLGRQALPPCHSWWCCQHWILLPPADLAKPRLMAGGNQGSLSVGATRIAPVWCETIMVTRVLASIQGRSADYTCKVAKKNSVSDIQCVWVFQSMAFDIFGETASKNIVVPTLKDILVVTCLVFQR